MEVSDLHKRFSYNSQIGNQLLLELAKNLSLPGSSLKKCSSLAGLANTDRSIMMFKNEQKNKNNKQRHDSVGSKNNQLIQLNKKLLNDIHIYRRQIAELKAENQQLLKFKKEEESKYDNLRKNQIELTKQYNLEKQRTHLFEMSHDNIEQNSLKEQSIEQSMSDTNQSQYGSNFDVKMIISRNMSQQMHDKNMELQVKIETLQIVNKHLENQVSTLKTQMQNILQIDNTENNTEKTNSLYEFRECSTQTIPQIPNFKDQSQQTINESRQKENQLQNKVDRLQNHIKQIQKKHSNLKNRCHTIRHLISGSS